MFVSRGSFYATDFLRQLQLSRRSRQNDLRRTATTSSLSFFENAFERYNAPNTGTSPKIGVFVSSRPAFAVIKPAMNSSCPGFISTIVCAFLVVNPGIAVFDPGRFNANWNDGMRSSGEISMLNEPFSISIGIMLILKPNGSNVTDCCAAPAVAILWMIGISPPARNDARSPEIVTKVGSARILALECVMIPCTVGLIDSFDVSLNGKLFVDWNRFASPSGVNVAPPGDPNSTDC